MESATVVQKASYEMELSDTKETVVRSGYLPWLQWELLQSLGAIPKGFCKGLSIADRA